MARRLTASAMALLAVGVSGTAWAQPSLAPPKPPTNFQVGLNVPIAFPVGGFGENVGSAAGITGSVDYGLGLSPVSVGGEAAYMLYGMFDRQIDLGESVPELAGQTMTVSTDNAMFLLHARVRVQPRHGRWRPYVDGLAGFNYIYTRTSLDGTGGCTGYYCSSDIGVTNQSDFVPSFGAGAGVMVRLGSSPGSAKLDLSVRYLGGGQADYLRAGAIHAESGQLPLDTSRSKTNMVAVYVGVSFGR